MKNKKELCLVLAVLVALAFCVVGCEETRQTSQSKVWGQGDPPAGWQDMFGNDNIARLNFVQTNALNSQGQAFAELAERVRKLEVTCMRIHDPNNWTLIPLNYGTEEK